MLQVISFGLSCTKVNLLVAGLMRPSTSHRVLESDLLAIHSPRVRGNRVSRNLIAKQVLGETDSAGAVSLEETHGCDGVLKQKLT